jgi:Uma2 family endonuclease
LTDRSNGKPPGLENGDRLTQPEFHRRYEAMPEDVKAELIGGIVYMASPLKPRHGSAHARLVGCLILYEEATPGVEALDNTTAIMDPENEPQPDAALILSEGGNTWINNEGFLEGAPEFIAEIASTSAAIDLHRKREEYEKAQVHEYMVADMQGKRVYWWKVHRSKYVPLKSGADGIFRSEVFPGLWLDPNALLRLDTRGLLKVLRQGLASRDHAKFVARLARRRPRR